MAIVTGFKVDQIGLDNNRLDLFWRFVNPDHAHNYEIIVLRAKAISGPFEEVARTFNAISYTDWEVDPDLAEAYYYKIRVYDRSKGETVEEHGPQRFEPPPDVLAREIVRRSTLLLNEFIGTDVLYYPLRTSGDTRCPDCWDDLSGQRLKSRCETCFDTGFIAGYYNPILMKIFLQDDPTSLTQNPEVDEYPVRSASSWMPGHFMPMIGDLIVEHYQSRWVLHSYSVTEKLRFVTTYRMRLHHVLETDVRYRVPLPQEDLFLKLQPTREYTRPYTLLP